MKTKNNIPEKPEEPQRARYTTQDVTKESLIKLVKANSAYGIGLAIYVDELSFFLKGLNQYKGRGNDEQYFLQTWTKSTQNIVRKSDNTDYTMKAGHNIIGSIQPKVLDDTLLKNGIESSDGMIERFLYCTSNYEEKGIDLNNSESYNISAIENMVKTLACWSYREEIKMEKHMYYLDNNARKIFNDFSNEISHKKKDNCLSDLIKNYLQKQCTYVARFALICHCINDSKKINISGEEMLKAIKLSKYFISSFKNLINDREDFDAKAEYALNYIRRKKLKEISPTQLYKSNDTKYKTNEIAKNILENLARKGYGRIQKSNHGVKFISYCS